MPGYPTKPIVSIALSVLILLMTCTSLPAAPLDEWNLTYNDGGGGIELESPSGDFRLRQLGYLQFRSDLYNSDFERTEEPLAFGIRRARMDWIVDINDKYQFFVEIDGADGGAPNQSDFDLVVARISGPLYGGGRWYAGKFITPFSTENNRSSRSLDMIERYMALNSLFLLPALDVQYGGMVEKPITDSLTLMTGVFNGNGRAADNLSDNNGEKEFQFRIEQEFSDRLSWSLSFDRSHEEPQTLSLEGYSFTNYSTAPVQGTRRLYGGSFDYTSGRYSLRGEALYGNFTDAGLNLAGGYIQPGYFLHGDDNGGLQTLLRLDIVRLSGDRFSLSGDSIRAITLGVNWYVNGNVRLKTNLVGEDYDGPGNNVTSTSGVQGDGFKPYLLTELQMKF